MAADWASQFYNLCYMLFDLCISHIVRDPPARLCTRFSWFYPKHEATPSTCCLIYTRRSTAILSSTTLLYVRPGLGQAIAPSPSHNCGILMQPIICDGTDKRFMSPARALKIKLWLSRQYFRSPMPPYGITTSRREGEMMAGDLMFLRIRRLSLRVERTIKVIDIWHFVRHAYAGRIFVVSVALGSPCRGCRLRCELNR